jgi:type III restriction enzyme
MKLKFKNQPFQTAAVSAVVDCFKGQPFCRHGTRYRVDPGNKENSQLSLDDSGFRNSDLELTEAELIANIQNVQKISSLPISSGLISNKVSRINLDIEMETGTGKTYCYIKTMFELNAKYGWSKFIIVVPSIAIREGVYKSLSITADHFSEAYGKKARFFIYNSKQLHQIEAFSSDSGINVMVINVQAFAARGADNRRIYDKLDDFQSRRPIDVIKANKPILIIDEPQKMEGTQTLKSLEEFGALAVLRYSATHKTGHNKIHRLDALDAYSQKLVKKIAVRGISVKNLPGTNSYLYLETIQISSKNPPVAKIEIEIKSSSGTPKREIRAINKGDNLFDLSRGLDQYKGFVVSDINSITDTVSFTNGIEIKSGDAFGDIGDDILRRIQIREAIKAHFDKEKILFNQGVKVLSLFFIDEVIKYRDYSQTDEKGEYARIFEEEYNAYINELGLVEDTHYGKYLKQIPTSKTHSGYFSIDKKSKKIIDSSVKGGEADDVDAYDLILKDKERLLSFEEPVRFIFSHSALREGWDNPNVFVICALKHSDNTISRRQEVGRGLRLSVNQNGDRMDDPATVHQFNVLTVVASEGYKDFVAGLQSDIVNSLSERPRLANVEYFQGKILKTPKGDELVTPEMARQIYQYLLKHDYVDTKDESITNVYHHAKKDGDLAPLPEPLAPFADEVIRLIDAVFSQAQLPEIEDDRGARINPLNDNFDKKEFKELWSRINRRAAYTVHFDSKELIQKCIKALDSKLKVASLQYTIQTGVQLDKTTADDLKGGEGFKLINTDTETHRGSIYSSVKYDLIGKIADSVLLTRATVVEILKGINAATFAQFKTNPENFISEAILLINEQKATTIIEHLTYNPLDQAYGINIFTETQFKQDFSKAGDQLKRHVYDYVITDSKIEREFVKELDTSSDVVVYAKLPKGFFIPTPVGNYNPDWAISFKEGSVKHIYFVAETKGSMSSMELREIEKSKIECAKKFFESLNKKIERNNVQYDVVNSFNKLMQVVS